jgi:hypothetical protein
MRYGQTFLDKLRQWSVATVTGPQRSGTRIAAKIIAADLGRTFVGEEEYKVGSHDGLLARYFDIVRSGNPVVIHGPALSSSAHYMPGVVVFMIRSLSEIVRSQERIQWAYEEWQLARYFTDTGPIAAVKYRAWHQFQKPMIEDRAFDLEYSSLAEHPLWVPAEQRAAFSPHQTAC